jgi:hypothetical protein
MNNRYQELIGDEAKQRQLKASAERAKKKAEKSEKK